MAIAREPASSYVLVNLENKKRYRLIKGKNYAGRCPRDMVHVSLRAIIASRQHAELFVHEDDTVSIYDVGSGNGTFINGYRIEPHVPASVLEHDAIGFGMGETPVIELSDDQILPMFELQVRAPSPPPSPSLDSSDPAEVDNCVKENEEVAEKGECDEDGCSTVQDASSKDQYETCSSIEDNLMPPPPPPPSLTIVTIPQSIIMSATSNIIKPPSSSMEIINTDQLKNIDANLPSPDNPLVIDLSRVKVEDCIIEIEDDEDEDIALSQAAFAPPTSVPPPIPDSMFRGIKTELDQFGLNSSEYVTTIDLTKEPVDLLEWLNDFKDFETGIDNNVQGTRLEDGASCDTNDEQPPVPIEINQTVDTVEDTTMEMNCTEVDKVEQNETVDSDNDFAQKLVRRINKRRYSQVYSDSEPELENNPKSDTDSVDKLIQKYGPKSTEPCTSKESTPSTSRTEQQLQERQESPDDEDSDDVDDDDDEPHVIPQPKNLLIGGPAAKKLKSGSNYVESRMDTKGIQLELAKRHKLNKQKNKSDNRPVTNMDLLDKHTRENIVKRRRQKLKSLTSAHAEEIEKREEDVIAGMSKATAKVKVSKSRGMFLCDGVDNTGSSAGRPPSKYKIPSIIEPHNVVKKVRIAHNSVKTALECTSASCQPSTSNTLASYRPTDNAHHQFTLQNIPHLPALPINYQPTPITSVAMHPAVACMINWSSRSFYDYYCNPRSGVPELRGVAVETLPHTRTWYETYEQYKKVMEPLMEIELWMSVYADWSKAGRAQDFFRARIDHMDVHSNYIAFNCRTYVKSRDLSNAIFRKKVLLIGSFQIIDPINTQKRSFMQMVTYVHSMDKRPIYHNDDIPPNIINGRADFVVSLTLLTKTTSAKIDIKKLIRCNFVSYVSNTIKLFDAVQHLKHSPLKNILLNPSIDQYDIRNYVNYDTPMFSEVTLNDSQRRAVLEASFACSSPHARIYLIDGPPGTGKTTVITQLIRQLLFNTKSKAPVQILLVAPSNGAIDNLMLKLIEIKKRLAKNKNYSFKLIRVGSLNQIHPGVMRYCVEDYAIKSLNYKLCKENPSYDEEYTQLLNEIKSLQQQRGSRDPAIQTELRTISNKIDNFTRSKLGQNFHRCLAKEKRIIINQCHVICSTLSSCFRLTKNGDLPLNERLTCCIVDEATQSVEQDTLIPLILNVDKMILVGDPQQLPAVTSSPIARTCGYGQSLFARIKLRLLEQAAVHRESWANSNIVRFLDTQYRMHPQISLFPNQAFYNGRLKDAAHLTNLTPSIHQSTNQQTSTHGPTPYPFSSSVIQQRPCPVGLRNLRPYMVIRQSDRDLFPSQQYGNQSEVELVVGLFKEIGKAVQEVGDQGNQVLTVGIITPYNRQKEMIENDVLQLGIGVKKGVHLSVTTVDGVQGQEKDIVIISNVRMYGNSFVENENRLNVALTRAKHVLYIIGSDNLFENSRLFREIERDAISRKLQATIPNSSFVREVIRIPELVPSIQY